MLITESNLRKLIYENFLLEVKKLNELKENAILYSLFNEQFIALDINYDLNNPKSPGRHFSEILYACMRFLNSPAYFSPDGQVLKMEDLRSVVYNICENLVLLHKKKEIKSKNVNYKKADGTAASFKEYIDEFNQKFASPNFQGNNILEKIDFVCNEINEKSAVNSPDIIINNIQKIKKLETKYPFGENVIVDNKYKVVCPQTMASSIFWARTNAEGREIILPGKDDINWCTGRYKESNWFNTYFIGFGANLYYFLPIDDIDGVHKVCVGFFKEVDEVTGEEKIYAGDSITVSFNNHMLFNAEKTELTAKNIQVLADMLDIETDSILVLIDFMRDKAPRDTLKFVSLMDFDQFKSATNLNTIAPKIAEYHGMRDPEGVHAIGAQVSRVLEAYSNPKYLSKYAINQDILNYCIKMWPIWMREGLQKNLNAKALFKAVPGLTADKKFMISVIEKYSHYAQYLDESLKNDIDIANIALDIGAELYYFGDEIRNNRELVLDVFRKNSAKYIDDIGDKLAQDRSFVKEMIQIKPTIVEHPATKAKFGQDKELMLMAVKNNGYIFKMIDENFRKDFDVALAAVLDEKDVIKIVDPKLKRSSDFCTKLYLQRPDYFNTTNNVIDAYYSNSYTKDIDQEFQDMYQFVDVEDDIPPPPPPQLTPPTFNPMKQEDDGFFGNIVKKFKRVIGSKSQQNEGKIIRMTEVQLRNLIRKELLK